MNSLHDLLADGTRYAPRYRPSMNSDHMPMTLCAITGLGGSFATCVAYRDDYKKILHEFPPQDPISNWRQGLGQRDGYPSLFAWFSERVAEKGIDEVVSEYLPACIGSLAMEAFHPIIRLGYAIDFKSEPETAAALAYIVSSHRDVSVDVDKEIDLEKNMRKQTQGGARSFVSAGFTRNICELLDANEYSVGRAAGLGDCAAIALDVYRSTRDFFALHMVTATQAVRICSELIDTKLAVAALTGGLLAAHRVVGSPDFHRRNPMPVPERLDREHTYKYAWTCLSEYRHYGDDRYAEEIRGFRRSGLIPEWCAADEV